MLETFLFQHRITKMKKSTSQASRENGLEAISVQSTLKGTSSISTAGGPKD